MANERGVLIRWRQPVPAAIDMFAWAVSLPFAVMVRYDFHLASIGWGRMVILLPLAVLAQVVTGLASGLYLGRWRFGSFDEVAALARSVALTSLIVLGLDLLLSGRSRLVPISAPIAGGLAALVIMAGARYSWRLMMESKRRPTDAATRILVFGAGEGGAQVLAAMLRDPASQFLPVALLDDDARKRNLRIMGVPVVGGRAQLEEAARAHRADSLLVAIPTGDATLVSELNDLAIRAGLDVKVLPPVSELFNGSVGVGDIRDVTVADLLGRHEIQTDVDSIAGYLTGKRVLVTGAGGSIGSELCRQIYRFAPAELIMLDRDESALHGVQLSIEGRAMLDSPNLVLCDIRDQPLLEQVFERMKPQVVFHAAALKHLTLLELNPAEAVKSNVWGTLSVLSAAANSEVERFVNISTDKASDPISVLGYSKRIAERLTAHFAASAEGTYLSVRFGNVLGSRGSVLETFQKQIDAGGPITITHPDISRFFMTIPESVQLVIQAGAIGRDGEALVLDMGEQVRIVDLATRLATQSERPIKLVFTGLRPGEKLAESLIGANEADVRPLHPLISHVAVPSLDPAVANALQLSLANEALVAELKECCREATSYSDLDAG